MKTTLLSAVFAIASAFSFGQISITVGGATHASGTSYTYSSAGASVDVIAHATNTTAAPINLTVQRVIENQIPSWKDLICWGTSSDGGLSGQCYFNIQGINPYTTPDSYTVDPGDYGDFKATITPEDPDFGCGEYKYYFILDGTTILDSVEVVVCKTASVEELSPISVSVAPNPANSSFTVKANNANNATVKMVDVLGNLVLEETVMGPSKKVNTSNFRNGVYFVIVEAENKQPVNRKVIVRH